MHARKCHGGGWVQDLEVLKCSIKRAGLTKRHEERMICLPVSTLEYGTAIERTSSLVSKTITASNRVID